MGVESSFPFITFSYADIIISSMEVNFQVMFGRVESIEDSINQRKRIAVLDSDFIKCSVVSA
jgi:hypothetical protein